MADVKKGKTNREQLYVSFFQVVTPKPRFAFHGGLVGLFSFGAFCHHNKMVCALSP